MLLINLVAFGQLLLAMILGMLLGIERSIARKTAGMRTYALVSMGCCLFVVIANIFTLLTVPPGMAGVDPLRMAAAVVTGIGFIGAGLILHAHENVVTGVTTSAGIWVAAGIGIAVGFKLYSIAIFATVLTLIAFTALWFLEKIVAPGDKTKPLRGESRSV